MRNVIVIPNVPRTIRAVRGGLRGPGLILPATPNPVAYTGLGGLGAPRRVEIGRASCRERV